MVVLNTLIPAGSSLKLASALAINNEQEIIGLGLPPGCSPADGEVCEHAFVLIPCREGDEGTWTALRVQLPRLKVVYRPPVNGRQPRLRLIRRSAAAECGIGFAPTGYRALGNSRFSIGDSRYRRGTGVGRGLVVPRGRHARTVHGQGSGAKLQFLRPKLSGDHQKNRISGALQYKHFRLKLFEIESLHQNLHDQG
jgi:hypothetical protein